MLNDYEDKTDSNCKLGSENYSKLYNKKSRINTVFVETVRVLFLHNIGIKQECKKI